MMLKETTVYVDNPNLEDGMSGTTYISGYLEEKEGYFHTKQELIELLGSVWNGGELYCGYHCGLNRDEPLNFKQFINSLFNTEEDGK